MAGSLIGSRKRYDASGWVLEGSVLVGASSGVSGGISGSARAGIVPVGTIAICRMTANCLQTFSLEKCKIKYVKVR